MPYFIKIDNIWTEILTCYKRENNVWLEINQAELTQYLNTNISFYAGHISGDHTLSVAGATNVSGETSSYIALYDGRYDVTSAATWLILTGSTYATIGEHTGIVTILSSATASNVSIGASYQGLTDVKDLVLTYKSGSSAHTDVEVIVDESGNTETTTTTVIENEDGSSNTTSTTIITDESGNTIGSQESETNVNADGSYNESTTNYNENGEATDTTNVTGDTQGNVDTQDIVYDDQGVPTVTGYTIDTSNNPEGSKDITGDGVNTGFYPFDGGDGFELHIKFRSAKLEQPNPPLVEDTEDKGSNYHFTILCSKDPRSPYPGFHIRWTLSKTNYNSGNLVFGYRGRTGSSTNRSLALSKHDNLYEYRIAYDPELKKYPSKFRCEDLLNGAATISLNIDFNPLNYGLTLGYNINMSGEPYRYSNVDILEFSITKL